MSDTSPLAGNVATVAGLLTVVVVLVLARAARRPTSCRPASPVRPRRASGPIRVACAVVVLGLVAGAIAFVGLAPVVVAGGVATIVLVRRRRTSRSRRAWAIELAMPDSIELLV